MDNSNVLIKKVKEKLGEEKISCLDDIFKFLSGFPPEINRREYRKHNIDRMDILDELESLNQLLRTDESHTHYRITPYVLLLADQIKVTEELFFNKLFYTSCSDAHLGDIQFSERSLLCQGVHEYISQGLPVNAITIARPIFYRSNVFSVP